MIAVTSEETFLQNQTDLTIRFDTGPLHHTVVTGIEAGRETSSPIRTTFTNVATTNLLNPFSGAAFLGKPAISANANTVSSEFGAYVMDTIDYGEHWELTAGGRFDLFDTDYSQIAAPVVHLSRNDALPSVRAALSYKPTQNGRVYFAYGTSFNPSAESLSLATNTADLAPEENVSFELGTKWDVLNQRLTLTGAVFQIEKVNARVPDPTNSAFNVLGGDQRVRGFELGAAGSITQAWQVYTGYAYLASKVVKSSVAASLGVPLANTPQNTCSLWIYLCSCSWYGAQLRAACNTWTAASPSPP